MTKEPKVSIIIPFWKKNKYSMQCIEECLKLDYSNFEVIVVRDENVDINYENERVRIVSTKQICTGPAEKRDLIIALKIGDIVAFIDDDAYPARNWLKKAVSYFENDKIEAVGGPGLTPPEDNILQKAGGAVIGSVFGSGPLAFRCSQRRQRFVYDFPSYNLLVKRSLFKEVGGFGTKFYGGEDSFFCLKIKKMGRKILYVPDIIVYHHRRPLFVSHLKQIGNFGRHRGYFAKKYPATSRRLVYFLPLFLVVAGLAGVIFSFFSAAAAFWFWAVIAGLSAFLFLHTLYFYKDLRIAFLFPLGIFATHFVYGLAFLKGLSIKHLER